MTPQRFGKVWFECIFKQETEQKLKYDVCCLQYTEEISNPISSLSHNYMQMQGVDEGQAYSTAFQNKESKWMLEHKAITMHWNWKKWEALVQMRT